MSTVLIADDEPDMLMLMELVLGQRHEVVLASDGAAALNAILAGGIDLAVLDMMMPELTGLEVIHHARQSPWLDSLPILVVTALSSTDKMAEAREAGATAYLTKPFSVAGLRDTVDELLSAGSAAHHAASA